MIEVFELAAAVATSLPEASFCPISPERNESLGIPIEPCRGARGTLPMFLATVLYKPGTDLHRKPSFAPSPNRFLSWPRIDLAIAPLTHSESRTRLIGLKPLRMR